MELNSLKKQVSSKKRKGRGISAGSGKTAGRGTKGQRSRAGGRVRPGFEGGQNPLMKRIPKKRGFSSRLLKAQAVTFNALNKLEEGSVVTWELLRKERLVSVKKVKIVAKGELNKKLTIKVPISKVAAEKVVAFGGKVEN